MNVLHVFNQLKTAQSAKTCATSLKQVAKQCVKDIVNPQNSKNMFMTSLVNNVVVFS